MLYSSSSGLASAGMLQVRRTAANQRKRMMSRFAITLFTFIVATVFAGGTVLMPASAAAASISKADKVALKEAIIACKAEARGKKVKWLARRKYVSHCVVEALKDRPHMDVIQLLKNDPDMKDLPTEQWDAF